MTRLNTSLEVDTNPKTIDEFLLKSKDKIVCDFGCLGWRLLNVCEQNNHHLIGVDMEKPLYIPKGVDFRFFSDSKIDLNDDSVDIIVVSHVLEHVQDPITFYQEIGRVVKPGGLIYIESPSELSIIPASSDDASDHSFNNFWDDPTHVRPYTPGSLYRLAISCKTWPISCGRGNTGGIPVSRLIAEKSTKVKGVLPSRYVSFLKVSSGVINAWKAIWPEDFS